MENQVATTQENALASNQSFDSWGSETVLDSNDIIIPKILLMQSDSKLVEEEKAKNKDFVNSSTKEVMENIEFTPFDMRKVYKISVKRGNSTEFAREEDWTPENDERQKEWTDGDDTFICQKIWRFYGLVKDEGIPFVLDLRGMSFSTGKRLANQMFIVNKVKKLSPAGYKIILGNEKQDYEGATKNVFTYKLGAITPKEELDQAFEWYKTLKMKDMKLDNSEEEEEVQASHSYKDVDAGYVEEPVKEEKKESTDKGGKDDLPW